MGKREKASSLIDSLLDALDTPEPEEPTPQQIQDDQFEPKELIVDQRSGKVRQAGADLPEGQFIDDFRRRSEESLFVFSKGVLSRDRLTTKLHKPVCQWFTDSPPYRKLLLLPRDHYKTTIASQCLPIHILIQPKERNHYMPGKWGPDCRILLVCESEPRAANHLRWIESRFESCAILRALWPQCCWENPRRESKKWNEQALLLPRKQDYSDPTIQIKGVGGVVTGAHVDVMIKDDLISLEAANSATVMQTAIQWHIASRALMDDPDKSLEFIIGTRWAVFDLYSYIIDEDPTVDVRIRSIIEDGKPILPELFKLETIKRLKKEFGVLFPLLYMNSAADPSLVDFDITEVREHTIEDGFLEFESDDRDIVLQERDKEPEVNPDLLRGQPLNAETLAALSPRDSYLRMKAQ